MTGRRPKGTGSIRNRGTERHPRWFAYYSTGRGETRRQISDGPFDRKGDAEQWLTAELAAMHRGRVVAPSRATVAEVLDEWLEIVGPGLAPNTVGAHRRRLDRQIIPAIGHLRATDLRPIDVTRMLADLRRPGGNLRDETRGLSETSLQHVYSTLGQALGWAVRQRYLAANPVADVERPKRDTPEMVVWSADELRRFLEVVDGHRLHALFHLAAFTGARRSELLGLRWPALDLERGVMEIRRRRVVLADNSVADRPGAKSQRGVRSVELDDGTVAALRRHRLEQAERKLKVGPGWAGDPQVFLSRDGRALHPNRVHNTWTTVRRKAEAAGLPRLKFHELRHTHASIMLAQGVPVVDVARRLGDTPETVLRVYAHAIPGQDRAAAEGFARLVTGR